MNTVCAKPGDFKKYFDENMHALGLAVPASLFDSFEKAVETAAKLSASLYSLGAGATLGELLGATFLIEKLLVVAAVDAAYYTGAVVGSIAVAIGRVNGCGTRLVDVYELIRQHDLFFIGWDGFFVHNPQVLDARHSFRKSFAMTAGSLNLNSGVALT